jgi:hypothetical protein
VSEGNKAAAQLGRQWQTKICFNSLSNACQLPRHTSNASTYMNHLTIITALWEGTVRSPGKILWYITSFPCRNEGHAPPGVGVLQGTPHSSQPSLGTITSLQVSQWLTSTGCKSQASSSWLGSSLQECASSRGPAAQLSLSLWPIQPPVPPSLVTFIHLHLGTCFWDSAHKVTCSRLKEKGS